MIEPELLESVAALVAEVPAADAPATISDALVSTLIAAGPIGIFFIAVLFKFKLMTVSEHESVVREKDARIASLDADLTDLKTALKDANAVYTSQVIPTLTRVLDAERELVDLRREEQVERRRRGGEA